ncbi:hypothetical protein MTR67_031424 [Solanum verrucosum]|uniref:Uncharacterized protein n=1 Tax=Solanum verrucosum TaxID=315347 RepID=A0AAF0U2G8_SOLVR|nr:hypothetical protein MTR67_031424 [Solanum verrucosum]
MGSVAHVENEKKELERDVYQLAFLGVCLMDTSHGGVIVRNGSETSLVTEVKEKHDSDPLLLKLKGEFCQEKVQVFSQGGDGVIRYQSHLCGPNMGQHQDVLDGS